MFDAECSNPGDVCRAGVCVSATQVTGQPVVVRTVPATADAPEGSLIVREASGAISNVRPIPYENGSMPQCRNAYKAAWQCGLRRYKSQEEYQKCREYEGCFIYDAMYANGLVQPISIRMTPECAAAGKAALVKTARQCISAQPSRLALRGLCS
jgi:hypothetical protein